MEIGILIDEIASFQPKVIKAVSAKTDIKQIRQYHPLEQPDSSIVYLMSSSETNHSSSLPKHVIISRDQIISPLFSEYAETIIQVPENTDILRLHEFITNSIIHFNDWKMSMMLAILQNKNIDKLMDIAAEKITNPIALFDKELFTIAIAGHFDKPYTGTIWEKVIDLGYTPFEFYTPPEQQEISNRVTAEEPYLYNSSKDKNHTFLTAHVWVEGKMYWSLGLIDINAPITDGQVCVIKHIRDYLSLYIRNDAGYKHISNNDPYFIINMLQGMQVEEKVVTHYLSKRNWKLHDSFCFLNILSPVTLNSPIPSLYYLNRVREYFPESFVTIYGKSIIAIVRLKDDPVTVITDNEEFKELLVNSNMICGVSAKFSNFLSLRIYYTQSSFAVDYCRDEEKNVIQNYEECCSAHLIQAIGKISDIRCFCHPQILEMRESGEKNQLELIHTLRVFLLYGRNIAMTSEALFIHRNTLIYRLEKIANKLKMNLNELTSDQLFYLLVSCMIAEHL